MSKDSPIGYTVEGILGMAGGKSAVARAIGRSVQTVSKWERRIPSQYARDIAVMAGLPLELVRPDMVRAGHAQMVAYAAEHKQGESGERDEKKE